MKRIGKARGMFACVLVAFGASFGGRNADGLQGGNTDSVQAKQFPRITRREVWETMVDDLRARGVSEEQIPGIQDIDLPVLLPAAVGRKLLVTSRYWDPMFRRTQYRLACRAERQCLPFLAYVDRSMGDRATGEQNRDGPGSLDRTSGNGGTGQRQKLGKPWLRAGEQATALFVSGRLRVTARVTCLQRGGEGEFVRVRRTDGQIFRARVAGSALVEVVPQ